MATPELSPSRTDDQATVEDVVRLYDICLGRAPDAEAVAARHRAPLRQVADVLIESPEFAARIHRLCGESRAPGADPAHDSGVEEWLQRRFGVNLAAMAAAGPPPAIAALLQWDLSLWTTFRKRFGRRAPDLLARLMLPRAPEATDWIGFIEVCSEHLIQGWVLRRSSSAPVRLALYVNDMLLATTEASLFRPDVADATGCSALCGFNLQPRLGPYVLRQPRLVLTLRDADTGHAIPFSAELQCLRERDLVNRMDAAVLGGPSGAPTASPDDALVNFAMTSALSVERYAMFRALHRIPPPPHRPQDGLPSISVVVLLTRSRHELPPAIASLRAQTYPRWEAVLVDGGGAPATTSAIAAQPQDDPRIITVAPPDGRDEAALRNAGLDAASGEYVCVAHEDDAFDPEALGWIAYAAHATRARLLYADEARFEAVGDHRRFVAPRFKPAFDYDLLLATHYAVYPLFAVRDDARAIGGFRPMPAPASDLDYLLRLIEHADRVGAVHVPLVLASRPVDVGGSTGEDRDALDDAVAEHLSRTGGKAALMPAPATDLVDGPRDRRRVQWLAARTDATLAIVIATRNRIDLLPPCIESLRRTLAIPSCTEIIVVDNQSDDHLTLSYLASFARLPGARVLPFDEEFNWSRANNLAAASTDADLLLFMNNDMEMITPAFDLVVRGLLERPDVGAVGALLLYDDSSIQHAGVAVGVGGTAAHIGVGRIPGGDDRFDMHLVSHRVGAVTGAFLAMRRTDFERVHGCDEAGLKVTFNDVDLCLKIRALGLNVLYTPGIRCFHHESATRGADADHPMRVDLAERESALLASRWRRDLRFDPFYNPSYCRDAYVHSAVRMPSAGTVAGYLAAQTEWLRRAVAPGWLHHRETTDARRQ